MKKLLIIIFITANIFAQQKDPYTILNSAQDKFNEIEDYEVNITIIVDVNFLKVPETKAKILFKQPDKVKLRSEGFALLPKEGLNYSPTRLLQEEYDAIYVKPDTIVNHVTDVIKVIPSNDESDVVLTSLWIDREKFILRKIETTTKKSGTFLIDLSYDESNPYGLPSEVKFSFNLEDVKIPTAVSGVFDTDQETEERDKRRQMVGTVTILYENYKVNQGIDDIVFEEESDE